MKFEQRPLWQQEAISQEKANGEIFFLGLPDRWMENPTWRCENGHMSKFFIKSEAFGGDCCPKCMNFCWLTFPEDKEI